jgi:hypothetical protein
MAEAPSEVASNQPDDWAVVGLDVSDKRTRHCVLDLDGESFELVVNPASARLSGFSTYINGSCICSGSPASNSRTITLTRWV